MIPNVILRFLSFFYPRNLLIETIAAQNKTIKNLTDSLEESYENMSFYREKASRLTDENIRLTEQTNEYRKWLFEGDRPERAEVSE